MFMFCLLFLVLLSAHQDLNAQAHTLLLTAMCVRGDLGLDQVVTRLQKYNTERSDKETTSRSRKAVITIVIIAVVYF